MDYREILARFDGKKFIGTSDYYPAESKVSFLKVRLEPYKLTIENQSPNFNALFAHEAEYDKEFNVVAFREKKDGKLHKEYSPEEIKQDRYNIISGRFLLRDPRYVLRHGHDLCRTAENSFIITSFEEEVALLGKTSVKVEIIFEENYVRIIRRKFVRGNKELNNQREIINFKEE